MAAVQKGTTLMITYGSFAYTGYIPEDLTLSFGNSNIEVIRDEAGATKTKILMDPDQQIKGTFVILGASGSIVPPAVGASVGLTPPQGTLTTYYVVSADAKFAAGATRLTLDLIKETSVTYT